MAEQYQLVRNRNYSIHIVTPSKNNNNLKNHGAQQSQTNGRFPNARVFQSDINIPVFQYFPDEPLELPITPISAGDRVTDDSKISQALVLGKSNTICNKDNLSSLDDISTKNNDISSDNENNLKESQLLFESPLETDSKVTKSVIPFATTYEGKSPKTRSKPKLNPSGSKTKRKKRSKGHSERNEKSGTPKKKKKKKNTDKVPSSDRLDDRIQVKETLSFDKEILSQSEMEQPKSYISTKLNSVSDANIPKKSAIDVVDDGNGIADVTAITESEKTSMMDTTNANITENTSIFEFHGFDNPMELATEGNSKGHTYFHKSNSVLDKDVSPKTPKRVGRRLKKKKKVLVQSILTNTKEISKTGPAAYKKTAPNVKANRVRKQYTHSKQSILPYEKRVTRSTFRSLSREEQEQIGSRVNKSLPWKVFFQDNEKSPKGQLNEDETEFEKDEKDNEKEVQQTEEVIFDMDAASGHSNSKPTLPQHMTLESKVIKKADEFPLITEPQQQRDTLSTIHPLDGVEANDTKHSLTTGDGQPNSYLIGQRGYDHQEVEHDDYLWANEDNLEIEECFQDLLNQFDSNFIKMNGILANPAATIPAEQVQNLIPSSEGEEEEGESGPSSPVASNIFKLQEKIKLVSRQHQQIAKIIKENHEALRNKLDRNFMKLNKLHDLKILKFLETTDSQINPLINSESDVIYQIAK